MNTIELRGTISNIRYIPTNIPTYHFIVNGQYCSYQGSLPLEMGDYVRITGRPNELTYTNNMGVTKVMKQIRVTSIAIN